MNSRDVKYKPLKFKFNRAKTIETILYIAQRIPDPTFFSLSKLLYFADKTSLEKYGRFITGDTYYALANGPVPSSAYALMKSGSTDEVGFRVERDKEIVPLREPDLDEFSRSDIECLDAIIALYGNVPFWKRKQDSHDEAWRSAWENKGNANRGLMTIESIIDLLEDSEELLAYLTTRYD